MIERDPRLLKKNYDRPDGNVFFDPTTNPHVTSVGDFVTDPNWCAYIIGADRNKGSVTPTRQILSLTNTKGLRPGTKIMIDCEGGRGGIRVVQRVVNDHVILLKAPLNADPLMGGEVLKIIGEMSNAIDTRHSK